MFNGAGPPYDAGLGAFFAQAQQAFPQQQHRQPPHRESGRHEKPAVDTSRLETIVLTAVEVANLGECGICFEEFEEGAEVYNVPCYHVHHKHCIEAWWRVDPSCPVCRGEEKTGSTGNGARHQRLGQWESDRLEALRTKRLKDWTNEEILLRLQELKVHVPRSTARGELVETLLMMDTNMGMRIGKDRGPEEPRPAIEGSPAPSCSAALPRKLSSAAMRRALEDYGVDAGSAVTPAALAALYDSVFDPPVESEAQPAPPTAADIATEQRQYLRGLPVRELCDLAAALGVDTAGVLEKTELVELVADASNS
eukprot:TRINITY_DN10254_c0_g1_i2.p1 TRINITY_DN10254_c0_g1~~TRINITY_DN10254_c0_g1_i2.p1  ORF type:complete len:310 (+),score=59.45 TRINITY_DN10254_c0_g1_i2:65-994(+)